MLLILLWSNPTVHRDRLVKTQKQLRVNTAAKCFKGGATIFHKDVDYEVFCEIQPGKCEFCTLKEAISYSCSNPCLWTTCQPGEELFRWEQLQPPGIFRFTHRPCSTQAGLLSYMILMGCEVKRAVSHWRSDSWWTANHSDLTMITYCQLCDRISSYHSCLRSSSLVWMQTGLIDQVGLRQLGERTAVVGKPSGSCPVTWMNVWMALSCFLDC